jgi:hypothetical protein
VDDDPAEEDDDLEEDLEAVVVSSAFTVVSVGFNVLAPDSILAATAPVTRGEILTKLFSH